VPTTMPPMVETAWPMAWGKWMPDSWSNSKAISSPSASAAVEKGTYCLMCNIISNNFCGTRF
jgi:hypothetical protein